MTFKSKFLSPKVLNTFNVVLFVIITIINIYFLYLLYKHYFKKKIPVGVLTLDNSLLGKSVISSNDLYACPTGVAGNNKLTSPCTFTDQSDASTVCAKDVSCLGYVENNQNQYVLYSMPLTSETNALYLNIYQKIALSSD